MLTLRDWNCNCMLWLPNDVAVMRTPKRDNVRRGGRACRQCKYVHSLQRAASAGMRSGDKKEEDREWIHSRDGDPPPTPQSRSSISPSLRLPLLLCDEKSSCVNESQLFSSSSVYSRASLCVRVWVQHLHASGGMAQKKKIKDGKVRRTKHLFQ